MPEPVLAAGASVVTDERLDRLRAVLADMAPVVVAFSGGADSAFLVHVATTALGINGCRAVTAVSPSLADDELTECARLAEEWGLAWSTVTTDELANPAYALNNGDRCFHCKSALMDALGPVVTAAAGATVVLGVNLDDLTDHRPGQQAASERGARFPLVEAGLTKSDVRDLSRQLGLRTWDKPAAACLASRIPYGTTVTLGRLTEVERAERALRQLGFRSLRVRHYDDTARIEVPVDEIARLVEIREQVSDAVHAAGFRYVTVDIDGLRSGNLNQALGELSAER
ncbi:MAG: ATP-dependent sacrificial sulfur transferase LarE [Acidimicrobiia bacterium]